MDDYLRSRHRNDIIDLMNDTEDSSPSIYVDLAHLNSVNPNLFKEIVDNVHAESLKWSQILLEQQKLLAERDEFLEPNYQIKTSSRVRFINLPELDARIRSTYPTNDDIGVFVQIKGTVLRCTQPKFLEYKKDFICARCKMSIPVDGEYAKYFAVTPPLSCTNGCVGKLYTESKSFIHENHIDYQEIKIMEPFTKKSMPSVVLVTLENDLVESCQPGDSITVCGTVESRWSPPIPGKPTKISVVIRANSITNNMKQVNAGKDLPEHLICVRAEWEEFINKFGELGARDILIQSMCPDVHGMYLAKLAVALSICSADDPSLSVSGLRNHSHLLLIGDPGLAKSRLLKFASLVSTRSVHTTGAGCSEAGLTASAVKEDGEWHLEAGALVLADNGICCIDEFNLMSEAEKSSLHEAMEQQTISMAKADIACKLNTRCVIIAATNPKNLYAMTEDDSMTSINLGIASPLLSRFDLVLILRDERNVEWDTTVADHILFGTELPKEQNLLDVNELQTHFTAVRDVDPVMTDNAHRILKAYYTACRSDEHRDAGRTTMRLNDSLYRLAKAHAKLLFRYEVTELDAVLVIMLMESSYGFGRIFKPMNIVREDIPLGPSDTQIKEVMERFHLGTTDISDNQGNHPSLSVARNDSEEHHDTVNVIATSPIKEKSPVVTEQPFQFDLSKYQFKKRKIESDQCHQIFTEVDENVVPVECVVVRNEVNTTDLRVPKTVAPLSENRKHSGSASQLSQTQRNLSVPTTSSRVKKIWNDYDEDELDKLFSLDEPIFETSRPNSTRAQIDAPPPEYSRSENPNEISQQEHQTEHPGPNANQAENLENKSQPNGYFSKFKEDDLSCFDSLDF